MTRDEKSTTANRGVILHGVVCARGYTLIEMMVVLSIIALVSAIAYPRITDTLRKLRGRDGAKAIVNAVINAKSEAMIRNLAHVVTLVTSQTTGSQSRTVGAGGLIVLRRAPGTACVGDPATFLTIETFDFMPLNDVNLCLAVSALPGEVGTTTSCQTTTVNLCVTPDGTVSNIAAPNAPFTLAYVREYEVSSSGATAVGVVRQVVIPRRKSVHVNPVQVTNDVCL